MYMDQIIFIYYFLMVYFGSQFRCAAGIFFENQKELEETNLLMIDWCLLPRSESNPIPYVATAVWNTKLWSRYPDFVNKLDDLYIQKYERITALICNSNTKAAAAGPTPAAIFSPPGQPVPSSDIIASAFPPPPPIPVPFNSLPPTLSSAPAVFSAPPPAPPPRIMWTRKELLKDRVGKVTSIIDDNYGLAVVRFACSSSSNPRDRFRAIVLFDTCDLWLGEHTATELNLNLGQCMQEGDYIKVKALLVPESENQKNIR
jgi:hypothetical protein